MKKATSKFNFSQIVSLGIISLTLLWNSVMAAITVTSSGGTPSANYTYLYQAFNAINTGTHTGVITIVVSGTINDGTTTATLNASGSGSASYTSVTMYPTATATIYANSTAASVIELNGADNVIIDGRINQTGSTQSLTIRNINTSSSNYQAKTLYLHGDACYNEIRYCIIEGSSTYTWGSTEGTIYFADGIITGNDYNVIEYCNIKKYSNYCALRGFNSQGSQGWTTEATATATISGGAITGVTITNGGTGYTGTAEVVFTLTDGTGATGTVSMTGGSITGVTMTQGGSGYTVAPVVKFIPSTWNSNNTLRYNNFYDQMAGSTGFAYPYFFSIYISSFNTDWAIEGNSFYETSSISSFTGQYHAIYIYQSTGMGKNFIIKDNFIGGRAPECGGGKFTISSSSGNQSRFEGLIYVRTAKINYTNLIENNTIKNIDFNSYSAPYFTAIILDDGGAIIQNNTVGSSTEASSIIFQASNSTQNIHTQIGISVSTPEAAVTIRNNTIGGMDVQSLYLSVCGVALTGLSVANSTNYAVAKIDIYDNLIGSPTVSQSMRIPSIVTNTWGTEVTGIYIFAYGNTTIYNNTISNLWCGNTSSAYDMRNTVRGLYLSKNDVGTIDAYGNNIMNIYSESGQTGYYNTPPLSGIFIYNAGSGTLNIFNNEISNVEGQNSSASTPSIGIYKAAESSGTSTTNIYSNFVHDIKNSSSSITAKIIGIMMGNSYGTRILNVNCFNNIISLGSDVITSKSLFGVYEYGGGTGDVLNIYYNTVYISGVVASNVSNTYAFYSYNTNNYTHNIRDNIFSNARSNTSGSGSHYAIYLGGTTNLTINYNDYYTPGTGGILGYLSGNKTTLAAWQAVTLQDANSLNSDPLYNNAGGTLAADYITTQTLPATTISGYSYDYYGSLRAATPTMGAIEGNTKFWDGSVSSVWETAGNWSDNSVPTISDNLIIPDVTTPAVDPVVNSGVGANSSSLIMQQGSKLTIQSGGSLITSGTISNNGTILIKKSITDNTWHLISSPMTNATANVFLGEYLQIYTEATDTWTDIIDPATALTPGRGYAMWGQAKATTYTFTGTPNTGNVSYGYTYTPGGNPLHYGFNLMGNPYPSSIDWDLLNETYGAVYYYTGSAYVTWNGGGAGSQYVPPMQGFLIAPGSAGTLNLTNAHRTHSGASGYYKEADIEEGTIILDGGNSDFKDELYIMLNENATDDFDLSFDAWKLFSGESYVSQLFSYTGDKMLSIDQRPECNQIPLGFRSGESGTFSIGLKQNTTSAKTWLEDTQENVLYDLSLGTYSFDYSPIDPDNRFILHLSSMGIDPNTLTGMEIYSHGETLYVKAPNQQIQYVRVSDPTGRQVKESAGRGSQEMEITLKVHPGIYLVTVATSTSVLTKKVYVKK